MLALVQNEAGLQNGFNLGESELVLSAVVDPYFDGLLIMTVSGDGATALEESWLQTRLLPAGLKVKMGKFLSGIGYQNSQHKHTWDFADQNLAYLGLLGGEGFKDVGVQVTWLAPTPFYALFGLEALQGHENLDETNMLGGFSAQKAGPRINTIFAKFAPDLGTNHVLQWGLSYAQAKQYQQLLNEDETTQSGV